MTGGFLCKCKSRNKISDAVLWGNGCGGACSETEGILCDALVDVVGCVGGAAILLQLVVQGFQADTEDLRGPGLVISGGLERLKDQAALCFVHRGTHLHLHGVGGDARICRRHPHWAVAEAGWQM